MEGPSDETLSKLAGMIPSMAQGIVEGKIHGSDPKGGKICIACTRVFGRPRFDFTKKPDVCKDCRKTLTKGGVIFVCDDARMIKFIPKGGVGISPQWAKRVVKVPTHYMDTLYATHKETVDKVQEDEQG